MRALPLWIKLLGAIGALALACVALAFIPTGQVAYAPYDPVDIEGSIKVDGTDVEPLQGRMYLVGVTQRKVHLLQRLLLDIGDSSVDFGPEPTDANDEGASQDDVDSMARAQEVAAALAFQLDGQSVEWSGKGATITGVVTGTPAAGALKAGDVVLRVNATEVDNGVDLGRVLGALPVGRAVTLRVRRAGTPVVVRMTTIAPIQGDTLHRSRIGAQLDTIDLQVRLPRKVTINPGKVVGPSAGLAFTLYLYDSLDKDVDLLGGRHVVVSGAVAPDGRVREVGRVRQKAIAAQLANRDVLIVPMGNVEEADTAIKDACPKDARCVRVIGVGTVREAVDALRDDRTGSEAANPG